MAKSYDIADLMTSDGEYLTDQVRRKINGNFSRILQLMQTELPRQQQQSIVNSVSAIVESALDEKLPEMRAKLFDDLAPVGSVIVTWTSGDPRLSHGTWQQVGSGRYIRAAGGGIGVADTGGSYSIEITEANLPITENTVQDGTGATAAAFSSSADPEPITVEPEYLALLFYRRIA